jgi:hypothetical protein
MSYLRIKTIKNQKYLYRQTSVRKGKKVKTISEYLGFVFCAPIAAMSPGRPGGYKGHKSTDARANKHQDQANRERFEKEMENPRERLMREAAKAAGERSKRPEPKETEKDREAKEAIRGFNEARSQEKGASEP